MKLHTRGIAAFAAAALLCSVSQLSARTWTDVTGKHTFEGEFVQAKGEWVQVKTSDGKLVPIKIELLSKSDRDHVKQLLEKKLGGDVGAGAGPQPKPKPKPLSSKPPAKTGKFQTSFTEHAPMAAAKIVFPRMLEPRAANDAAMKINAKLGGQPFPDFFYDIKQETFQVFVPDDYTHDVPYGLFVFINSGDKGGGPKGWQPVLKKHRLIFIGADNSGNEKDPITRRTPLAVEAVYNMSKQYNIDRDRVYVSGNSGGGRAASWTAQAFPDLFTGGQFHIGVNFLPNIPSPTLRQRAKQNRYALITGDKDFNLGGTKAACAAMQGEGFQYVTFLQVPGMGHKAPPAEWFEKGIVALDAPLIAAAKPAYERGVKCYERKQWSVALAGLRAAAAHGGDQPFVEDAKKKLQEVAGMYDADVAAIEQEIEQNNLTAANKLLAPFRKRWAEAGANDAIRLAKSIKEKRSKK